jgi:hypothetical protein
MKYTKKNVMGYWTDAPILTQVCVALEEWDGVEDAEDEGIFYYMDGKPLAPGMTIAGNFVVTGVNV